MDISPRPSAGHAKLGKVLDPLADKLLLVSVFITLAVIGLVPVWLATIAVLRDVVIGAGAVVYKWLFGPLEGRPTVPSKLNTLVQLVFVIAVVWQRGIPRPSGVGRTGSWCVRIRDDGRERHRLRAHVHPQGDRREPRAPRHRVTIPVRAQARSN